mgnify:CR=1 FL=1
MDHGTYSTWEDTSSAVRMECNSCKEAHTFKSDYFAKQWANRHGVIPIRLIGLA